MQQNPVVWFEIPVNDIKRATAFYERVLGVSLERNEMGGSEMAWFPMTQGGPGAAGTLIQGEGYTPSHNGSLVYL
jgi:predicted enzyme related to lactoylglutathione lyase